MLGLVVCGLRTWICTMAAPALAASIEERAICSGVTGTAGLRPGVSAEPVTAQEIMTLRCVVPPNAFADDRYRRASAIWLRARNSYIRPERECRGGCAKRERPRARGARSSGVA